MFKKNRSEIQTTWSEKMLREFIDNFLSPLSGSPGRIPFLITEKETHIHFSENKTKEESLGYYGILPQKGLENVQFSLSQEWPSSKEHKGCIGYLELLNGVTEDLHTPGPIIRGFIKTDLGFFETFNTLLRDAKIFGWKHPIMMGIHIDFSVFEVINTGNILRTELGIRTVEFYHKLNVFDRLSTYAYLSKP